MGPQRLCNQISMVALLACASCGHAPRSAAEPIAACTIEGAGSVAAPWRQARGDGFTFCLPPAWGPSRGANSWTGPDGTIAWATGGRSVDLGTSRERTAEVVTAVPLSDLPRFVNEMQSRACVTPTPQTEQIAGRAVSLRSGSCSDVWSTSAAWGGSTLQFAGLSRTSLSADVQLAIYRTVRLN